MKIAVMQPAFIPPASYFRLFAAADLFVILDDVQFNRRWYTHRQMLQKDITTSAWFTLPVKKSDRDTTHIMDLEWADGAGDTYEKMRKKFLYGYMIPSLDTDTPLSFVVSRLEKACRALSIEWSVEYASGVPNPNGLKGQDRIIDICKYFEADEYINSPGGVDLYDKKSFEENNIKLSFLPKWTGSYDSIIERLATQDSREIRVEIYAQI